MPNMDSSNLRRKSSQNPQNLIIKQANTSESSRGEDIHKELGLGCPSIGKSLWQKNRIFMAVRYPNCHKSHMQDDSSPRFFWKINGIPCPITNRETSLKKVRVGFPRGEEITKSVGEVKLFIPRGKSRFS